MIHGWRSVAPLSRTPMSTRPVPAAARAAAFALVLAVAGSGALAQTAPPIKPGLWSYEISSGNPAEDAQRAEAMKGMQNMPPAQRAQIESMMKQRGVSLEGNTLKVCQTKESLESGRWAQNQDSGNCKTDFTQRGTGGWKWRTSCPDSVTEGTATFTGGDRYVIDATTTPKGGSPRRMQVRAAWQGTSCGDIKPAAAPSR